MHNAFETQRLPDPEAHTDTPGFDEFRHALHGLIAGSCCGGGALVAAAAAPPARRDTPFRRLGFEAWRAKLRPRPTRVPTVEGVYVLPEVTVVLSDGASRSRVDVEIAGERVVDVRPAGAPTATPVVEAARGAFVSPALIDLHVHLATDNALKLTDLFLLQFLRAGITVVRDAGDPDGTATPAALAAVLSGSLPGPEIHYAYAFVNAPPSRWANAFAFEQPDQAEAIVSRLKALGARWVKSYENLDLPRLRALCQAAEAAGLGVMGHVPFGLGLEEALIPDIQHLHGVAPPRTLDRNHILDRMLDWRAVDRAREDVVVRACVAHRLALTPTLAATLGVLQLERHHEASHEAAAAALPRFFADVVWHPDHGIPAYRGLKAADFARAREAIDKRRGFLSRLFREGVTLRLGTDTQQPFVAPGVALHQELEAFEACGISRKAVFDVATTQAAQALGLSDVGRVKSGGRAELIVARSDPRQSGWSVERDLLATVARGRLVWAADLDRAIDEELGRFRGVFAEYTTRWLARFTMHRIARRFGA